MGRAASLNRALTLMRIASRLVPSAPREEWRLEWEGELHAASDRPRIPIVRHALGSFVDAFWIRQRDVADLRWESVTRIIDLSILGSCLQDDDANRCLVHPSEPFSNHEHSLDSRSSR